MMAIVINARGTSQQSFKIGKSGDYIGSDNTEGMYISSDGTIGSLATIKIATPVDSDDAASMSYVDTEIASGENTIFQNDTDITITDAGTGAIAMTVDATAVVTINVAKIDVSGTTQISATDGSVTAPAYTFETDIDAGLYYDPLGGGASENQVGMAIDGTSTQLWRIQDGSVGNNYLVVESADGEVKLLVEGSDTDANIRLTPKGVGEVFLGDPGSGSTISASDGSGGNAGESLFVTAGSGTDVDGGGGDIVIRAGNAFGAGTDGTVQIQDGNSDIIAVFNGSSAAINYVSITGSNSGNNPLITVDGAETNRDLELSGKGLGLVTGPTGYDMSGGDGTAFATKEYVDDKTFNTATKTAGYTTTEDDDVIFADSTGGAFAVTLGTAATLAGMQHVIKDSGGDAGANTITIATQAAQTIDGAATQTITNNYESLTIISDGTNWFIV